MKIMNKMNFVRTSDEQTKKELEKYLNFVSYDGKYWTFVNDPTINFSKGADQSKLNYTNKLYI